MSIDGPRHASGEPSNTGVLDHASPGVRLVALIIDGIPLGIVATLITLIAVLLGVDVAAVRSPITQSLIEYVLIIGYFAATLPRWGQTLGAKVMHIRVVGADGGRLSPGKAALRGVVTIISTYAILLGYLWAFWDRRRQTWHDKAAGSFVVKAR